MNKALRIYLFSFAILIVLMIAIDRSRKKPIDWRPTYGLADKIPLGLYVLDKEMETIIGDSVMRYNKTFYEYYRENDSLNFKPQSYLFINDYFHPDEESLYKLLESVKKGSSALISSDGFPDELIDTLRTETEYKYKASMYSGAFQNKRDTIKLSLTNQKWADKIYSLSPVFGQIPFCKADTATTTALGYMIYPDSTKYINFIRIKFGKGYFFLHNQPSAFTNYSLLSDEGLQEYAANTLSYLPGEQPAVWFVQGQSETEENNSRTPLSIIFKYPALRMTWLIFIYGLLAFLFFTAKRRQRVVPIIKPLRNTTIEFAQTIGNLYFQEGDTTNIARKKIIYFLDRIRQTYYIDTQSPDDTFAKRLHLKSGKDEQLIANIIHFIRGINDSGKCSEFELTRLNKLIEDFRSETSPKQSK